MGQRLVMGATTDHETTTSLELGDFMAKLDQIDKKLKCSEEDRKEGNKIQQKRVPGQLFLLARATEEKLQQMSGKVEATDKDREKNIKKDIQEMKQRYDTVNHRESGDEDGHCEQRPGGEFVCHTVQTGCHLEKLYNTRQSGNKSNTRQQSRFRGTTTEQMVTNTVTVDP